MCSCSLIKQFIEFNRTDSISSWNIPSKNSIDICANARFWLANSHNESTPAGDNTDQNGGWYLILSLNPSLTVLGSFDKKKQKWSYFKERFITLTDEPDKHIVRGFMCGMHDNFTRKDVNVLIIMTLPKMLSWTKET